MNGLKSEMLKYKRTYMRKLIVWIPLFFALYSLVIRMLVPTLSNSWRGIMVLVFNWWPLIFLPLGMGLFAGMAAAQEKKAGDYRALLVHDISPKAVWVHKVAAMAIHSLLSALVLFFSIIISGLFSSKGEIPIYQMITGCLVCWLVSLVLIPIQLWAAAWKGILFSMGVAFAGMIAGVMAAPQSYWFLVPWSWATRLMCPIIGVHPNGTELKSGNPLLNSSVIPVGIAVSVILLIIITAISGVWFRRREIH
ncbi:lantibiotic immunity ABC transporter MutE/EpiE family permease subunit [Robinsoniella peoriensis]|uniref:lantibiotic immunity ABC transporter MutE/EpiE family permease subunit n=1 Tax=Robinsoniella peoriensis TaxID=180332 RepID=UPI003750FFD0